MTQEEFNQLIENCCSMPARGGVTAALTLAYQHPALMMEWVENITRGTETKVEEFCDAWEKSLKSKDPAYLASPEGKLMQAIYKSKKGLK